MKSKSRSSKFDLTFSAPEIEQIGRAAASILRTDSDYIRHAVLDAARRGTLTDAAPVMRDGVGTEVRVMLTTDEKRLIEDAVRRNEMLTARSFAHLAVAERLRMDGNLCVFDIPPAPDTDVSGVTDGRARKPMQVIFGTDELIEVSEAADREHRYRSQLVRFCALDAAANGALAKPLDPPPSANPTERMFVSLTDRERELIKRGADADDRKVRNYARWATLQYIRRTKCRT